MKTSTETTTYFDHSYIQPEDMDATFLLEALRLFLKQEGLSLCKTEASGAETFITYSLTKE
jgi:hypothetical protein